MWFNVISKARKEGNRQERELEEFRQGDTQKTITTKTTEKWDWNLMLRLLGTTKLVPGCRNVPGKEIFKLDKCCPFQEVALFKQDF